MVRQNEILKIDSRIWEIDFLRGFAIFMMILHHLVYDLAVHYKVPGLDWQFDYGVQVIARPFFVAVFMLVSGISSQFSRDNLRRGLKLSVIALLLTVVTFIVRSIRQGSGGVIVVNVLHVIALSILLYAFLAKIFSDHVQNLKISVVILSQICIFLPSIVGAESFVPSVFNGIVWGVYPYDMALLDKLPIFPWLGFFLLGVFVGQQFYVKRQTLLPGRPRWLRGILQPFEFMGRYSLWFYALHQPVLLTVFWLLYLLGVFPRLV